MNHSEIRSIGEAEARPLVAAAAHPLIVDVGADWCMPCRNLHPFLAKLAAEHADRLEVVSLDGDQAPDLRQEWQVETYPTLLLFREGALVERIAGFSGYAPLRAAVRTFVGAGPETPEETQAEAAFVAAVTAARDQLNAEAPPPPGPDDPVSQAFAALDAYEKAQTALVETGAIGPDELGPRMAAEQERLLGPLRPQLDAAKAAARQRLDSYAAAIGAAAATFLAARRPATLDDETPQFCRPGDPSCSI
ncbi:MAG: thioredoxin family protein [Alphaproteobacteria bacterium]